MTAADPRSPNGCSPSNPVLDTGTGCNAAFPAVGLGDATGKSPATSSRSLPALNSRCKRTMAGLLVDEVIP